MHLYHRGDTHDLTADFGSGIQTRTFYSAYFILDITNPERPPVLLWSYSAPDPVSYTHLTLPTICSV